MAIHGTISAARVSISPMRLMVPKLVMMSISPGILRVASSTANSASRPGNLSRANAKAARIVVSSVSAVLTTVTITVFTKYTANGAAFSALA